MNARAKKPRNPVDRAEQADQRGRRVGITVKDYERLAQRGPRRMAEALIARHNIRMKHLMQLPEQYRVGAIESLGPIAALDPAHRTLGISLDRIPSVYTGTWPRDAAWGVDSAIATVRLLLAGQVVGAATIARQQLERWTLVLAQVAGLTRQQGESFTDFVARAWTEFLSWSPDSLQRLEPPTEPGESAEPDEAVSIDEPDFDHQHIVLSDGTDVCPAVVYMILSETMHARECHHVTTWESKDLLDPELMPDNWRVPVSAISDAISLSLIQIGVVTAAALSHIGDHERAAMVANYQKWPHRFSQRDRQSESREFWNAASELTPAARWKPKPEGPVTPNLVALMPLTPAEGLRQEHVSYLDTRRWTYLNLKGGFRPAGRLYRDDEFATLIFDAHRFSAAQFALASLRIEAKKLGDTFDARKLDNRGSVYIVVSELAAVTSTWCEGTISAALKLISSSLRSSYWLWLEDDDRAMASLRCTLEQSARIVATIKNPRRAGRVEGARNLPSRWLEAAGWRRLSALNDALGEYAHGQKKVDPIGPRLLLSALQMDVTDDPDAIMTARGHALDLVTEFGARSVIAAINTVSSTIAEAALRLLDTTGPLDLSDHRREQVLNHAWGLRATTSSSDPSQTVHTNEAASVGAKRESG